MGDNKHIGSVTRYFHKIGVAAIMLEDKLKVGDNIRIEGTTTSLEQTIHSMQIDRESIEDAKAGQEIAIKVVDRVRENDKVYITD
ncbi:MAG: translation elongation factor-like protein [Candidatus Thorarchaeota archaeon]|jgi:putative protease